MTKETKYGKKEPLYMVIDAGITHLQKFGIYNKQELKEAKKKLDIDYEFTSRTGRISHCFAGKYIMFSYIDEAEDLEGWRMENGKWELLSDKYMSSRLLAE